MGRRTATQPSILSVDIRIGPWSVQAYFRWAYRCCTGGCTGVVQVLYVWDVQVLYRCCMCGCTGIVQVLYRWAIHVLYRWVVQVLYRCCIGVL